MIFAESCFQISQFSEYSNFNRQNFQILKIFHFKVNIRGGNLSNVVLHSPLSKLYENASCQLVTKNAINDILETLLLRLAGRLKSKSGERVIPLLCIYSKQKSRKTTL